MPAALTRLCPRAHSCPCKVETRQKWYTQCLHPQRKSQLVSDPLADTWSLAKWIFFTHNPVTSETSAFALGPGMGESMHEPLKKSLSDSHSPWGTLDRSFVGFQTQTFSRLHLCHAHSKAGAPSVGHEPLTPSGEVLDLWRSSLLCVTILGRGFGQNLVSGSPVYLNAVLLSLVVERAVQLGFSPFSVRIIPYVTVDLVCPWKEVSWESSSVTILGVLPQKVAFLHVKNRPGPRSLAFIWTRILTCSQPYTLVFF